jgi:outer membrane immunogenic protein
LYRIAYNSEPTALTPPFHMKVLSMTDRNHTHLGAGAVIAAMLAAAGPSYAADIHEPSFKDMAEPEYHADGRWTGFYLGAHAGYGWGSFKPSDVDPALDALIDENLEHNPSGEVFGVQAGYNWQRSRWVFGIEGDVAGTNVDGKLTYDFDLVNGGVDTFTDHQTSEIQYLATLRGRIGIDVGSVLLYATGGLAVGRVDTTFNVTNVGPGPLLDGSISGSDSATHVGYAVGGGVETWLRPDLSVKAEYLYADLGDKTYQPVASVPGEPFSLDMQLVRVGLNYHF